MKTTATEVSFAEWAAARQHGLVRAAWLLTGDLHLAEDLVQEALVGVCLRWDRLADGHPDAYARRVIHTRNISWWRRRREVPREVLPEPDPVPGPDLGVTDQVRAALQQLPRGQRSVVVLRYYEGLSEAETADVLGVAVGTVKSQHHDAVKKLRQLLPDLHVSGGQ